MAISGTNQMLDFVSLTSSHLNTSAKINRLSNSQIVPNIFSQLIITISFQGLQAMCVKFKFLGFSVFEKKPKFKSAWQNFKIFNKLVKSMKFWCEWYLYTPLNLPHYPLISEIFNNWTRSLKSGKNVALKRLNESGARL